MLPDEVLLANPVPFGVPLDLRLVRLLHQLIHVRQNLVGLVLRKRLVTLQDFGSLEPSINFVDHH